MVITSATVILNKYTADLVSLKTDLPYPIFGISGRTLDVTFHAAAGTGKAYVEANFPDVPVQVIGTND
jgi:hypothetical protein